MKKILAVLALTMFTSSAFGQVIREHAMEILQVMPIVAPTQDFPPPNDPARPPDLPTGITSTNFCLQGPLAGPNSVNPNRSFPACRFVGNVLCLDPGPNGDFPTFQAGCPVVKHPITGKNVPTTPLLQGVTLRKIEPRVPKCPDIYPGIDFTQTGNSGIRTFWMLKFAPCGTQFILDLQFGCVGPIPDPLANPAGPGRLRQGIVSADEGLQVARYVFTIVIRPETFRWLIEALHCEPLGMCEMPCITDEELFQRLLSEADAIRDAAPGAEAGSQEALIELNNALDRAEALIVRYCFFTFSACELVTDENQQVTKLFPCAIFRRDKDGKPTGEDFIPGNQTIDRFGFGIVDTCENPCCCKLIADLHCLKNQFIGSDP